VRIVVNGSPREVQEDATVGALVTALGRDPEGRGVAVAVNDEVVPRGDWDERRLADGDQVEIVGAVQGGAA
jgi:sulfur carrier protein